MHSPLLLFFFIFCFFKFQPAKSFIDKENVVDVIKVVYKGCKQLYDGKTLGQTINNLLDEDADKLKLSDVKDLIGNLSLEINKQFHRLERSVKKKHFFSLVKHPMNTLFHHFQKFIENPNNHTRLFFENQCSNYPPLSTMEALIDILQKNWIGIMAKDDGFISPKLDELEKKLDEYVKTLVVSQAACSSLHDNISAIFDFRKLKTLHKSFVSILQQSRSYVHKHYFEHLIDAVKLHLDRVDFDKTVTLRTLEKHNINHVAAYLLKFMEENYNYGARFGVQVGQHENRVFEGNMPNNSVHQFTHKGFKILIFQSAGVDNSLTDVIYKKFYSNSWSNDKPNVPKFCKEDFICIYDELGPLSFFYKFQMTDVFASNGKFKFVNDDVALFYIAPAITPDYKYIKLQPAEHVFVYLRDGRTFDMDINTVLPEMFKPEKVMHIKKLFMETEIIFNEDEILSNSKTTNINNLHIWSLENSTTINFSDILKATYQFVKLNIPTENINFIFKNNQFESVKTLMNKLQNGTQTCYVPEGITYFLTENFGQCFTFYFPITYTASFM